MFFLTALHFRKGKPGNRTHGSDDETATKEFILLEELSVVGKLGWIFVLKNRYNPNSFKTS